MGSVKKAVKGLVKIGTLGAVDLDAKKKAERAAKQQQAAYDAQLAREQANADQANNRYRQESSDLASLAGDEKGGLGEMAGILTSVDGLMKGDRKLGKKKTLGG